MTTTSLTGYASTYAVEKQHVHFDLRSSTPTSGEAWEGIGEWRVERTGAIIHRANNVLDFAWLGENNDVVYGRFSDIYGDKGDWESYTYSVTGTYATTVYVDGDAAGGGDGTTGSPYNTIQDAVTGVRAILTTGEVGAIYIDEGQTYDLTDTYVLTAEDTTQRRIDFLRWGYTGTKPVIENSRGFVAGDKGSYRLKDLTISTTGSDYAAMDLGRFGGAVDDRLPLNVIAEGIDMSGHENLISFDDTTVTGDDRSVCSFAFLEDCSSTDAGNFHVYGYSYPQHFCFRNVELYDILGAGGSPFRAGRFARSYFENFNLTASPSAVENSMRWIGGTNTGESRVHSVSWNHCDMRLQGNYEWRWEEDGPGNFIEDLCFNDCSFDRAGDFSPSMAFNTTTTTGSFNRIAFRNTRFHAWMTISDNNLPDNSIDNLLYIHSTATRRDWQAEGVFIRVLGGGGTDVMADGAVRAYGCVGYWPNAGNNGTRSLFDLANTGKAGEIEYCHVGKSDNPGGTQGLVNGSVATGTNTSDFSTSYNFTNSGATYDTLDSTLTSVTSGDTELAGAGWPHVNSIDADDFLRNTSTPDAGAYEFGTSTAVDDPDLGSSSLSVTGQALELTGSLPTASTALGAIASATGALELTGSLPSASALVGPTVLAAGTLELTGDLPTTSIQLGLVADELTVRGQLPVPPSVGLFTSLSSYASTYNVGRQHVHFNVRASCAVVGEMNDRDAQGYWWVERGGTIIQREFGTLDFAWLGLDGDKVHAAAVDSGGYIGNTVTYTFSVTANTSADVVRYVDGSSGSDSNDGSSGSPWATLGHAVTQVKSSLTVDGQVGVIFVAGGQTYTESTQQGSDSATNLIRVVWDGTGGTRPHIDWADFQNGFNTGKRFSWHLEGLDLDGNDSAVQNSSALNISRSGTVITDRSAPNCMVVNCNLSRWGNGITAFDQEATEAERENGYTDFVALEDVTMSTDNVMRYGVYGLTFVEYWLLRSVTITGPGSNGYSPVRLWKMGRGYAEDFHSNTTAANTRFRLLGGPTDDPDGGMRLHTWNRLQLTDGGDFSACSLETDPSFDGLAYYNDVRFLNCKIVGSFELTADKDGDNMCVPNRVDVINMTSTNQINLEGNNVSGGVMRSLRIRNCGISRNNGDQNFITLNASEARYADGFLDVEGCFIYWPTSGSFNGGGHFVSSETLTREELIPKFNNCDYNHMGKVDGQSMWWARHAGGGSTRSLLSEWLTANSNTLDTGSSVNNNTTFSLTDDGEPTNTDIDLALTDDLGELSGAGLSLPSGVAIDTSGYLRDPTSPDAGPYEYGATDIPEDPDVGGISVIVTGALDISGELPTAVSLLSTTIGVTGALELVGSLPSASTQLETIALATGALEMTGELPSSSALLGTIVSATGALEVSGELPSSSVSLATTISATGALEITGELPTATPVIGGVVNVSNPLEVSGELPAPSVSFALDLAVTDSLEVSGYLPEATAGGGILASVSVPLTLSGELLDPSLSSVQTLFTTPLVVSGQLSEAFASLSGVSAAMASGSEINVSVTEVTSVNSIVILDATDDVPVINVTPSNVTVTFGAGGVVYPLATDISVSASEVDSVVTTKNPLGDPRPSPTSVPQFSLGGQTSVRSQEEASQIKDSVILPSMLELNYVGGDLTEISLNSKTVWSAQVVENISSPEVPKTVISIANKSYKRFGTQGQPQPGNVIPKR